MQSYGADGTHEDMQKQTKAEVSVGEVVVLNIFFVL